MMSARFLIRLSAIVAVLLLPARPVGGWGFWAHKEIHRHAITALPAGVREFFSAHADSIVERSVVPDLRRREDDQEQYYHYIDIDRYGAYPFAELPRVLNDAEAKYGADSVQKNGLVPWRVADLQGRLTEAMKTKNARDIVHYAADLGHYVADIHMPLHTTENYDGQLTGQVGIHWRFETAEPERSGKDYDFATGQAEYIDDPLAYTFKLILESYAFVDSVLIADRRAKEGIPERELFEVVTRNGRIEYHYSSLYYRRFNAALNGLPERRMRAAVHRLASFWYTAWVDAGEPKLDDG